LAPALAASVLFGLGTGCGDEGEPYIPKQPPAGVKATMPVEEHTRQPMGILHGGASVALAESVASVGAWFLVAAEGKIPVGMEINANHLRRILDGNDGALGTTVATGGAASGTSGARGGDGAVGAAGGAAGKTTSFISGNAGAGGGGVGQILMLYRTRIAPGVTSPTATTKLY
jgi:uncharacterized protein (TIGR00369 family)